MTRRLLTLPYWTWFELRLRCINWWWQGFIITEHLIKQAYNEKVYSAKFPAAHYQVNTQGPEYDTVCYAVYQFFSETSLWSCGMVNVTRFIFSMPICIFTSLWITKKNFERYQLYTILIWGQLPTFNVFRKVHSVMSSKFSTVCHGDSQVMWMRGSVRGVQFWTASWQKPEITHSIKKICKYCIIFKND